MDPNTTPGGSTSSDVTANLIPPASGNAGPATPPVVNSGQVTQAPTYAPLPQPVASQPPNAQDAESMRQYWESRVSGIQSVADRRQTDYTRLVGQFAELQQKYAQLEAMYNTTVGQATEANTLLRTQVDQLTAKNSQLEMTDLRNQVLLTKPALAGFAQFLPMTNDKEALQRSVELLEQQINATQAAYRTPGAPALPPGLAAPAPATAPNPFLPPNMQPQATQQQQGWPQAQQPQYQQPTYPMQPMQPQQPYQQQAVPPSVQAGQMGSSVSQGDLAAQVDSLLAQAMNDPTPGAWNRALEQSKLMLASDAQRQRAGR